MLVLRVGVYAPAAYTAGALVATADGIYGKRAIDAPVPGRGRKASVFMQAAFQIGARRSVAQRAARFTGAPSKKTAAAFSRAVRDATQEAEYRARVLEGAEKFMEVAGAVGPAW
eukprot:7200204-Lingulodinium_polyedra.AAC.1